LLSLPEERKTAISLVRLGKTLDHLIQSETFSYIDLIRLGDKLKKLQRLQFQNPEEYVFVLNHKQLIRRDIAATFSGYKRLLSPEMPNDVKLVSKALIEIVEEVIKLTERRMIL
jgi:hypothetical protein